MGMDEHLQREIVENVSEIAARRVPEVRGLQRHHVTELLNTLDIRVNSEGSGSIVLAQQPDAGQNLARGERLTLIFGDTAEASDTESRASVALPDLRGMSMRQAFFVLNSAGFDVQQIGSGTIYAQFPQAGSIYQTGREVTIRGRSRAMNETALSARVP
jgi:beta-lactam-binding protein with PASTA domain